MPNRKFFPNKNNYKFRIYSKIFAFRYKIHFGINIGQTKICAFVFPITGKLQKIMSSGKLQLQTRYTSTIEIFPHQLLIEKGNEKSVTFTLYKSVTDVFVDASTCFVIGQQNYGSMGQV